MSELEPKFTLRRISLVAFCIEQFGPFGAG
jgi:hypothetical protein